MFVLGTDPPAQDDNIVEVLHRLKLAVKYLKNYTNFCQ